MLRDACHSDGFKMVFGVVTAKAPLLDAAIAMVPDLDAQSRVGNNEELRRRRHNAVRADVSGANSRAQCFTVKPISRHRPNYFLAA